MESATKTAKICTKCTENPASNGHQWCQPCRTENARKIKELEAEMIGARNWAAGANALRQAMAAQLERAPGALFSAGSVVQWMRDFVTPDFPKSGV